MKNADNAKKSKTIKIIMFSSIAFVIILTATLLILLLNKDKSEKDMSDVVFSYSEGIDENGFWENIKALDYVDLFDYMSLSIPNDTHKISDGELQSEINNLLEYYPPEKKQITDRAVANGDKVNIDYVGSVDGVEFDGGNTGGAGTEVTAGSTEYIDDFLIQIIGHMPGETINVEVTFPENYGQDELNGKDAVFVTTINYIVEYDITDEFIENNFYDEYGWKTVGEMEEGTRTELQKTAIQNYIRQYIQNEITVSNIPDAVKKYQDNSMVDYYQEYSNYYGITLEEFLQTNEGISTKEELIEKYKDDNLKNATYSLVIQAIAEDADISVNDADMENYLPGYSSYEEDYGLPYLKQYVLIQKVLDYIIDNIVLM